MASPYIGRHCENFDFNRVHGYFALPQGERSMFKRILVTSTAAAFCCAPVIAQEVPPMRNNLGTGAYYSTGDYGLIDDTSIHYIPVSYERSVGNWNLQLAAAHIQISGYGNVLVNVGGVGRSELNVFEEDLQTTTTRGIGDTVLSATYQVPSYTETSTFFDIGFEVKLPTADEYKGHGTGEVDYGVQLDAYRLFGSATLFGTLGYKFRGQSSLFDQMTDSAFVSLGFSKPLNERWSYGVIYDFREAASDTSGETHELLPYLSWAPHQQWSLMFYTAKGFTQDSADIAIGAQLGYRW